MTVVLALPGRSVIVDEIDFSKLIEEGDSLLQVAPDVDNLNVYVSDASGLMCRLTIHVNEHHRLRDIEVEFEADNFMQAAGRGHDLISPLLSRWAYLHDAPIATTGFKIVEVATEAQCLWVNRLLGAVKGFADNWGANNPDYQILLSAYRDGISSTESLWQAHSLFRVIEGVYKMRAERREALIAEGRQQSNQSAERVPHDVSAIGQPYDFDLPGSLSAFSGQKFTQMRDTLRKELRNAIAHLDVDSDILIQDRWEDLQKVERLLPSLRWLARQLLDSELQNS